MRLFPKTFWRPLLIVLAGAGAIGYKLHLAHLPARIHDVLDLIPDELEGPANMQLDALATAYGADIHIAIDSLGAGRGIEETALEWVRSTRVGGRTSGRGMLVLIDFGSGRMRFEVAPHLQGVFTDAFTGYLLRQHLQYFTGTRQVEIGTRGLILLCTMRLQQALVEEEWDPTVLQGFDDPTGLGDGGGASSALSRNDTPVWSRTLPDSVKGQLGPQPTPEAVWQAYLRWVPLDPIDPEVDLFTRPSQVALNSNPYTRPFHDVELLKYAGRPYRIIERGDLAMVYVTNTPLAGPMLFRRSDRGWQIDVMDEWKHVKPVIGPRYAWGWQRWDDEWDRVFDDQFIDNKDGTWRFLKHGDLTPFQVGKIKWVR